MCVYPFFPTSRPYRLPSIVLSHWDTARLSRRVKVIELLSKNPSLKPTGEFGLFEHQLSQITCMASKQILHFPSPVNKNIKINKKQRPVPCIVECLPAFPASTHWKPVTNHLSPTHPLTHIMTKQTKCLQTYCLLGDKTPSLPPPVRTSGIGYSRCYFQRCERDSPNNLVGFIINYLLQDGKTKARKVGCLKSHCSK